MDSMNRRAFTRMFGTAALALASGRTTASDSRPRGDRIKVGQIGVGHAHATKLAVYRRSPDYEVVGIVEPDADLRKRAEGQPAFKDLAWLTREQLLNIPGLQAILVETQVADLLDTAEV